MSFPSVLHSALEIGLGVAYGVGAVFNAAYTLNHADDFYGSVARGAWFPPGRWFVEHVILREPAAFTAPLILFELTLAILILSRTALVTLGALHRSGVLRRRGPRLQPGGHRCQPDARRDPAASGGDAVTTTLRRGAPEHDSPCATTSATSSPAVVDATREPVLNALGAALEVGGREGHVEPALPHDDVLALVEEHGRITR